MFHANSTNSELSTLRTSYAKYTQYNTQPPSFLFNETISEKNFLDLTKLFCIKNILKYLGLTGSKYKHINSIARRKTHCKHGNSTGRT